MKKINRRSYLIEWYENKKGEIIEERHNNGFGWMSLLGVLERIQLEIINQIGHMEESPKLKKVYIGKKKVDNKKLEAK
jgi:hypothetical protein